MLSFQVERSQVEAQETCMAMVSTYKRQRSFEVESETGSVLCRIALWDYFRNRSRLIASLFHFFFISKLRRKL